MYLKKSKIYKKTCKNLNYVKKLKTLQISLTWKIKYLNKFR